MPMISMIGEDVKDFLKPLFSTLEPPNCSNEIKKLQIQVWPIVCFYVRSLEIGQFENESAEKAFELYNSLKAGG